VQKGCKRGIARVGGELACDRKAESTDQHLYYKNSCSLQRKNREV
jgi:hypothetical protein